MELLQTYLDYYNVTKYLTHNYTIYFLVSSVLLLVYNTSKENPIQSMSLENRTGILSTKILELEKKFNNFKDQATFTLNMLSKDQEVIGNKIQKLNDRISAIEELCYDQ